MKPRKSKRVILPVMTGVLLLLPLSAAAAPGFGDYTGNGYVDLDDYFWLPGCTNSLAGPGSSCSIVFS